MEKGGSDYTRPLFWREAWLPALQARSSAAEAQAQACKHTGGRMLPALSAGGAVCC